MKILNQKFDSQLKEIVLLHNITKHYILLGEETDVKFNSYLQPIKEFRDSYDHLLRAMRSILFEENSETEEYIQKQLSKALGHEYRAFFDVADWFSLVCRKAAYEAIENKKENFASIVAKYPRYKECVEIIYAAGQKIAEIRDAKDIGKEIYGLVNQYQEVMVQIYNSMMYIRNATILVETDME